MPAFFLFFVLVSNVYICVCFSPIAHPLNVLSSKVLQLGHRTQPVQLRCVQCRFANHSKLPVWPRWRRAWSARTRAIMDSTIGTALGRTQGSCRPLPSMIVLLPSVSTVS